MLIVGFVFIVSFVLFIGLYTIARVSHRPHAADTDIRASRGRYCYGEGERLRRWRQIANGQITVGYVPSLRTPLRHEFGVTWQWE